MNRWPALVSTFLVVLTTAVHAQTPRTRLAVVVSAASPITNISLGDLRRTYLGSITRWPDGHRIIPVVLRSETSEQRSLLRRIVQMTDIDYAQHWIGEVFRGRASAPPRVVASSPEAIRFVAVQRYAIAVIDAGAIDGTVRALTVDGKMLNADGYPLSW